ncbi:hypothetical protein [Sphingomonas sp.]|uniref:hypothetical protein n=1 Tax=Sphingomonas sp. TaxID=28214 RepID=UPI003B0073C7
MIAALGLALLLTGSAAWAGAAYPTGRFAVAGVGVAPAQVLDARALPDAGGKPSLMVTLTAAGVAAVKAAAKGATDLAVTLDGKPLGASPAAALADGGALQISGEFGDYAAASATARRISGKDPVPESLGDE